MRVIEGGEAADYMKEYYADMGRKIHRGMGSAWNVADMKLEDVNSSFVFKIIEIADVLSLINVIEIYKVSGVDGINSRILKDGLNICALEFTYLLNLSLS